MPYDTLDDLPAGIREALPTPAQRVFMRAYNAAVDQYDGDETKRFRIAWGAVKNAGYRKADDGRWVKTDKRLAPSEQRSSLIRMMLAVAMAKAGLPKEEKGPWNPGKWLDEPQFTTMVRKLLGFLQPRVPSGPKGGQWTIGGFLGGIGGAGGAGTKLSGVPNGKAALRDLHDRQMKRVTELDEGSGPWGTAHANLMRWTSDSNEVAKNARGNIEDSKTTGTIETMKAAAVEIPEGTKLKRFVRAGKFTANLKAGDVISDAAPLATTYNVDLTPSDIGGATYVANTTFRFTVAKGAKGVLYGNPGGSGKSLSKFPAECEIAFPPGTPVKIKSIRKEDDWTIIDAEIMANAEVLKALAQPRVPGGPKGGQWTSYGRGGAGGVGAAQGDKQVLMVPQLGQGGVARQRFERDEGMAAFTAPLKETEITGLPPYLDNPYGYVLKEPSQPTPVEWNDNPEDIASYTATSDPGDGLNGIPFEPWAGPPGGDWTKVGGTGDFYEPPGPVVTGGKRLGAGVIIEEPDGRIWTVNPLNAFGGYKETFPKGGIEPGLNLRQTAIKEAYEESGLQVELIGVIGDFERTTSVARYYRARRIGGDPTDAHWETQAVNAVPLTDLTDRVVHHADAPILAAMMGEPVAVQKALCAMADLIDAMPAESYDTFLTKKAGGAWAKQVRVPAGLPTGGQWTTYGSGGWGGAFGAGGVPLKLQMHGGTGPQSEALNKKIQLFEANANNGVLSKDAAKLANSPMPKQTYSLAAWQSAKETVAYVSTVQAKKAPAAPAAKPTVPQIAPLAGFAPLGATKTAPDAPAAKPTPEPIKPKQIAGKDFAGTLDDPIPLSGMTQTGSKPGGSAAGAVYTDAAGVKWLVKAYDNPLMAQNEVLASKIYNKLGVGTPVMKLVNLEGQYPGKQSGVASKFISSGVEKLDVNNPAHLATVQEGFAAHALLANWDVVGAAFDNVMIDNTFGDPTAVAVDPGGAMLFRAMGALKGSDFKDTVGEIDSLRNPATNPTAAKVFGKMTDSQIGKAMLETANAYELQKAGIHKAIDAYMPLKEATTLMAKLDKRAADLKAKAQAMEAASASTTTLDIATTGTTTGTLTHPNAAVTQWANSGEDLQSMVDDADMNIHVLTSNMDGGAVPFYEKEVNKLQLAAEAGDIDGVISAKYDPVKASTKTSANYGKYLKIYGSSIQKAELIAAQNLKAGSKPGDGTLVTGAAKVTAAQIGAAKAMAGVGPDTSVQTLAVVENLTPTVPKPAAPQVLSPLPAMPMKPKLVTPANPPGKLSKQVDEIEKLSQVNTPENLVKIQAIDSQIGGSNGYAKKAKQYAADVIAAMGGQPKIDAMPAEAKKTAFEAGIDQGNSVVKMIGNVKVVETTSVVQFNPKVVPEPPELPAYKSQPELKALNGAILSSMQAAALANDKSALDKIDPGPSQHTQLYKKNLEAMFAEVGKSTTTTTFVGTEGGTSDPAQFAADIGSAFKGKQNWDPTAEKFHKFVVAGQTDPGMAKAIFAGIPEIQVTTSSQLTADMLDQAAKAPAKSKTALKSFTGSGYVDLNNELRGGTPGTAAHNAALEKAQAIENGMSELPVGLMLSRKAYIGNFAEWEAMKGKILVEPGVNSTSINPTVWSGTVLLKMKIGKGVKGVYVGSASKSANNSLSSHSSEQELTLPRNTKWYVTDVKKADGKDSFFKGAHSGTIVEIVVMPNDPVK